MLLLYACQALPGMWRDWRQDGEPFRPMFRAQPLSKAIATQKLTDCLLKRRAVHDIGPVWDDEVLADPEVQAAIRDNGTVRREYIVTNQDRSALGRIGGAVARVHGVFSISYTVLQALDRCRRCPNAPLPVIPWRTPSFRERHAAAAPVCT